METWGVEMMPVYRLARGTEPQLRGRTPTSAHGLNGTGTGSDRGRVENKMDAQVL